MTFEKTILSQIILSLHSSVKRNAFFIDGTYSSYVQFTQRISAIRKKICDLQSDEQIFALAVHDDLDTYASIFALWMEGKAYVPLHPNQPLERNLNIIEQVGLSNVLDSADTSVFEGQSLNVMHTSQYEYTTDCLDNWVETSDDALAYILFTSEVILR